MKKSLCCFDISKKEKKVCWKISNACNFNCGYCFANNGCKEKTISDELLYENIKKLKNKEISYVILSGGEPLLCNRINKIVKELLKNKIMVSLCTNASLASETICNELYNSGLRKVTVSFDEINENSFNALKSSADAYKNSVAGIMNFIEKKFEVTINVVLQDRDETYLLEIIKFWKERGIKKFSFTLPVCKNVDVSFSNDKIERIIKYLENIEKKYNVEIVFCNPQCNTNLCESNKLIFGINEQNDVDECLVKEFII